MNSRNLTITVSDCVAKLTIARPDSLNALNEATLKEIDESLSSLESRSDVCALIVTGEGRAFVSGGDIAYMSTLDVAGARAFSSLGQDVLNHIERSPIPVIAAVNGYAFGGGLELALACDIRMAAQEATLGLPEVSLGIVPAFGGTQRMARLCGCGVAADLILTGRRIGADEALALGIVSSVHSKEQLLPAAHAKAALISSRAPLAVSLAKSLITTDIDSGLAHEVEAFALCMAHRDSHEGLKAFVERRAPTWSKPTRQNGTHDK